MTFISGFLLFLAISGISATTRCADRSKKTRIAVGFYGISRSLKSVMNTFQKHVFNVLDRSNIAYDVMWSTNAATETVNTRGGHGVTGHMDPYDVRLLEPCLFNLNDQEVVRIHEWQLFAKARNIELDNDLNCNITKYKQFDVFNDDMGSIMNILCAYHSMDTLEQMIESHQLVHKFKYDAVLVLRPDTAVIRDIDLPENMLRISQEPSAIWIPDFQHWGGLNDRAAFGSVASMSIYLKRGIAFRDASYNYPVSERLVKYTLEKSKITVYKSSMRVMRVRQDGLVAEKQSAMLITDEEWSRCVIMNSTVQTFNDRC